MLRAATSLAVDALPSDREGERWTLATHWNDRWAYVTQSTANEFYVCIVETGKTKKSILLPEKPTALSLYREFLYFGLGHRLAFVDLRTDTKLIELYHRKNMDEGKSYDLLVHDFGRLLAVDDFISPIYADWFHLNHDGFPRRRADWVFPDMINGHVKRVLFAPGNDSKYTLGALYILGSFSVLTGQGQLISAHAIRGDALETTRGRAVNGGYTTGKERVREEFISMETGRPIFAASPSSGWDGLVDGKKFTWWTSIALTQDKKEIALAAGTRGLLILNADFHPTSLAEKVDVGGECLDVVVHSAGLIALIRSEKQYALAVLRRKETKKKQKKWQVVRRYQLSNAYHKFIN